MTIKVSRDPHDKWEEASASQSIHWLYRPGILNFDFEAVMNLQYLEKMISNSQKSLKQPIQISYSWRKLSVFDSVMLNMLR